MTQMSEELNLGFCDAPRPKYIYCNRKVAGCNWYFFEDEKAHPIEWTALKCIILSVNTQTTERMQKESEKLRVRVRADREYILEAGATTEFAKAFMRAWNAMTPDQKRNPVYIEPKPADKSATALFVELYDHLGSRIRSDASQTDSPTVKSGSDNPIVQRVKDLVRLTGLPLEQVKEVCRGAGLPQSAIDFQDMGQVDVFKVVLFTAWAANQGATDLTIEGTGNDTADFVELRRQVNELAVEAGRY